MANSLSDERFTDALLMAPFHRWLNLELLSQSPSGIELSMPWRPEIVSNPSIGSAHGGILSALIDLTGLYTVLAAGGSVKATIDLRVDFHRPATGGPLKVTGRPVKIGRSIAVAEARIETEEGKLISSGRGAYSLT